MGMNKHEESAVSVTVCFLGCLAVVAITVLVRALGA